MSLSALGGGFTGLVGPVTQNQPQLTPHKLEIVTRHTLRFTLALLVFLQESVLRMLESLRDALNVLMCLGKGN